MLEAIKKFKKLCTLINRKNLLEMPLKSASLKLYPSLIFDLRVLSQIHLMQDFASSFP